MTTGARKELGALKQQLARLVAQKQAIDKQGALFAAQKQALEALDAFHLGTLTPQQAAEAQATFAQPLRQLVKKHEAVVCTQKAAIDEFFAECVVEVSSIEEAVAAEAWLREKGFEPDENLCEAIESKRDPGDGETTAMYEACITGELGVCRYLYDHGAAPTIRTKNDDGETPMVGACGKGHLQVAQWLFEVGTADDIRTKTNDGATPMAIACNYGHLQVAKWLFDVGAADDIKTADDYDQHPFLQIACDQDRLHVSQWLILAGSANNPVTGHVDASTLSRGVPEEYRPAIASSLRSLVHDHAVFTRTVVPATCLVRTPATLVAANKRQGIARACLLLRLVGHEETLLSLVADFAGIVRGRKLRNAREAISLL